MSAVGKGRQSPAQLKQGALLRPASRLLSPSLPSTVAFLAPFMVHSCPQLKRLGTEFSLPTSSEELKLCRGGLGAKYLSSSAGAETSPLGFGQERDLGRSLVQGKGCLCLLSAALQTGLRAVPLGAGLSYGLRNRKGMWSGFSKKGKPSLYSPILNTNPVPSAAGLILTGQGPGTPCSS